MVFLQQKKKDFILFTIAEVCFKEPAIFCSATGSSCIKILNLYPVGHKKKETKHESGTVDKQQKTATCICRNS